jgi:hypothetical protein
MDGIDGAIRTKGIRGERPQEVYLVLLLQRGRMGVQKQKHQAKRDDNHHHKRHYEEPNLARGFFSSNRFSFTLIIQRHSEPPLPEMRPLRYDRVLPRK